MCQSVSQLAAASNHGGRHHREESKTTEVNAGDLDVVPPPHPTLVEPLSPTPPLPSPSPAAFIYYKDDFRYCYDDDSHLQEDDDDGGDDDQLLQEDDSGGANQALEAENALPLPAVEERDAPTTGASLAAKVAGFARQKLAGVNAPGAVVMGLGLVGGAVGAYFLWPAAAGVTAVTMMKAPGAAGFLISRAAFEANPKIYYQILRTAGAAVAAAAFAV